MVDEALAGMTEAGAAPRIDVSGATATVRSRVLTRRWRRRASRTPGVRRTLTGEYVDHGDPPGAGTAVDLSEAGRYPPTPSGANRACSCSRMSERACNANRCLRQRSPGSRCGRQLRPGRPPEIGEDGKTLTQAAIPRLMNAYDEQAIEAALRLRDAGADCKIAVVSVGARSRPTSSSTPRRWAPTRSPRFRSIPRRWTATASRAAGGLRPAQRRRRSAPVRPPGVGRRSGCRAGAAGRNAGHAGGDDRACRRC